MADVIVMADSSSVNAFFWANPSSGPPPAPGQAGAIYFGGKQNIEPEPDVPPDVVVIGRKLKSEITNLGIPFSERRTLTTSLPCIGVTSNAEIYTVLDRLKFQLTNREFGVGRAGENSVSAPGPYINVSINSGSLKGYDMLGGGLGYLVAHEIAHSLKKMQEYNNSLWASYVAGAGKGLSPADQKARYPNSDEFKRNEARANTIARELMKSSISRTPMNFTPTNDFESCS